jgi:tetratricopeptide (TPR) repeat protein
VKYFADAVKTGKGYRSAVQELATCYQKLGMNKELQKLIEEHAAALEMSASLLSFHIGMLISRGNFDQAEAATQRLAAMPDDDGRSTVRRAQLLMMKQDFRQAEKLLSALLARGVGAPVEARRFRAIAAARAGNFELARSDIEFVQSRTGRGETAQRLLVHYELARRNFKKAEELLTALGTKSVHDDALRARILEEWSTDAGTPLTERERYRQEAVVLWARARDASAFDVE